MGIRFEKKTKLNWVKQMEEFLRLRLENPQEDIDKEELEEAYQVFLNTDREFFRQNNHEVLEVFLKGLSEEQLQPLSSLLFFDGRVNGDSLLLENARYVLESHMRITSSMSFEDYQRLSDISTELQRIGSL